MLGLLLAPKVAVYEALYLSRYVVGYTIMGPARISDASLGLKPPHEPSSFDIML